jgi:nanoRNase/pAp phosphatase (c-di-AMP/oligoRNAs hydrolase)
MGTVLDGMVCQEANLRHVSKFKPAAQFSLYKSAGPVKALQGVLFFLFTAKKVSLRSNQHIDTSAIAESFGGGGHKKASGYTVRAPMEKAVALLVEKIEKCYG